MIPLADIAAHKIFFFECECFGYSPENVVIPESAILSVNITIQMKVYLISEKDFTEAQKPLQHVINKYQSLSMRMFLKNLIFS